MGALTVTDNTRVGENYLSSSEWDALSVMTIIPSGAQLQAKK
jgi:hypothetical protein